MNKTTESRQVSGRGVTPGRYSVREDGSIFDSWGGYHISRDLWDRRISEGRSDSARHSFAYVDRDPVSLGEGWYLRHVECGRCGERREIGISVAQLNRQERWCLRPPTLIERIGRWFA